MSVASRPKTHGTTWRWNTVAVISALYVEVCPQPTMPESVVTLMKQTNSSVKVSSWAIFMGAGMLAERPEGTPLESDL